MGLAAGTRLGPYEIVAPLGAGGMGEVYRARDTKLNRDIAIKVLPEAFALDRERLARFEREAKTLAALNHPHIAQIYGLEQSSTTSALVMELVEGDDLAQRIARGPIPLDEALAIASQIAEALEAAHEQGIVHRDLKPANIKVRPDGRVKVLDFGLAKALDPTSAAAASATMSPTLSLQATQAGVILGTAAYMSPEQAKGKAVDKRTDVWAFGCVLYEMLTGARPFTGDGASDVLATVLKSEPDWSALPADVPPEVRLLIRGCLEKDPRKRAGDMAVARWLIDQPVTLPAAAVPRAHRQPWIRVVAVSGLLVLAIAGSVALTIVLTTPSPQPMRFTIASSSAASFDPYGGDRDIAVSPDGRRIVYRALVGGTSKLVVRDVSELEGKTLDGTDRAQSPFISSDGRWVGFFSGGALKKVSIMGGSPVTICRTPGALRGGSWQGDTILFATNDPTTGLLSVSAAGGEPSVLTTPDRSAGEGDHLYPSLLPDGRHALFTIASGRMEVALLDLQTKERKVVIGSGSQADYVPAAGAIVFAGAGSLRAARFDVSRGDVLSEPVPVLERVSTPFGGFANYAVSRDGLLVYVPASDADRSAPRRTLVWVARDGREEMLPGDARAFTNPRLSPDERQVLVHLPDLADDIWMLDVSRGALSRQTFDPREDETPTWLPDGKTIAYASARPGTRAVFRRRADSMGGEEQLWAGSAHVHVEAPTPDGRTLIVAMTSVQGGLFDLRLLPLDGDRSLEPLIETPFSEYGARVSPDGRWLAYASDETGRYEIYIRAFPSLEGKTQVSTAGGTQPVWSKRGDELFFRGSGAMMAVRIGPGASLSVGQPQRLFDDRYYARGGRTLPSDTGYDVARNGRFLMVKDLSTQQTATATPSSLIVVLNWFEELKAKLK